MTPSEERVLTALAASRVTPSVVTLAADIWQGGTGDVVGWYSMVLDDLAARGLVTFVLRGSQRPYQQLACDIRLTPEGWAAAGYPTVTGEVGRMSRHMTPPRHPGDRTDYRTHHSTSETYPIERLTLEEHLEHERTHYHGTVDDPHGYLGQWRCRACGAPVLRSGVCLVGCRRRDSELVRPPPT